MLGDCVVTSNYVISGRFNVATTFLTTESNSIHDRSDAHNRG
jgi:hypothetical protein